MNSFLKSNKTLVTYTLILLIVIPIFGLNFLISFFGNILLLLLLIPLLFLLILFLGLNSFKSKVNTCENCGAISLGFSDTCMYCGYELDNKRIIENNTSNETGEKIIEVEAEEIY